MMGILYLISALVLIALVLLHKEEPEEEPAEEETIEDTDRKKEFMKTIGVSAISDYRLGKISLDDLVSELEWVVERFRDLEGNSSSENKSSVECPEIAQAGEIAEEFFNSAGIKK